MEERILKDCGLCEINSSELQIVGGAGTAFTKIFEKVRNIIDFLADYIPSLVKGFTDGFAGKELAS